MPITTPPAVIQRIDSAFAAQNADDGTRLQANFAPDATIVDENSPFVWQGADAGVRWWHSVDRVIAKMHATQFHVRSFPPTESVLDREGDDAYVNVPLLITGRMGAKSFSERGTWVLTLHRTGTDWKITTATWATTP